MKFEKFEDILVWQKARFLVIEIYKILSNCRDFSFLDQIKRAALSISNNIAEGFEKGSNKDFQKFLYISKGSCAEVRSMLYIALDLNYVCSSKQAELVEKTNEISRMLSGLIKSLK